MTETPSNIRFGIAIVSCLLVFGLRTLEARDDIRVETQDRLAPIKGRLLGGVSQQVEVETDKGRLTLPQSSILSIDWPARIAVRPPLIAGGRIVYQEAMAPEFSTFYTATTTGGGGEIRSMYGYAADLGFRTYRNLYLMVTVDQLATYRGILGSGSNKSFADYWFETTGFLLGPYIRWRDPSGFWAGGKICAGYADGSFRADTNVPAWIGNGGRGGAFTYDVSVEGGVRLSHVISLTLGGGRRWLTFSRFNIPNGAPVVDGWGRSITFNMNGWFYGAGVQLVNALGM